MGGARGHLQVFHVCAGAPQAGSVQPGTAKGTACICLLPSASEPDRFSQMHTETRFSNVKETLLEGPGFHSTTEDWAPKARKPSCFPPELDRGRASAMCRAVCPTWTERDAQLARTAILPRWRKAPGQQEEETKVEALQVPEPGWGRVGDGDGDPSY